MIGDMLSGEKSEEVKRKMKHGDFSSIFQLYSWPHSEQIAQKKECKAADNSLSHKDHLSD